jgi:hypothetical protein
MAHLPLLDAEGLVFEVNRTGLLSDTNAHRSANHPPAMSLLNGDAGAGAALSRDVTHRPMRIIIPEYLCGLGWAILTR